MKLLVKIEREIEAAAIRCFVAVRYGEEDIPNDFPFRKGEMWDVTVDIATGRIRNWPKGFAGDCEMKVCDQGSYTLLDAEQFPLAERENDYVPSCIPGEYGDYIRFSIGADGTVKDWSKFCTPERVKESFFAEG